MVKIQIETLNEVNWHGENIFVIDNSKTIIISNDKTVESILKAKNRLLKIKPALLSTQKIRILEYHNDDPDETRQSCKILFEG